MFKFIYYKIYKQSVTITFQIFFASYERFGPRESDFLCFYVNFLELLWVHSYSVVP